MENNKNEEIIAYIKFYSEIKKVVLTPSFEEFKKKICNVLQVKENLFNSLKLSYKDDDGDTISVSSEEDYNILINQIKSKEVDIINIETDKSANIDIEACSHSILKFHEKIDEGETVEEEKNNKNNLNIISNQQFEIHEEKNNEQKNNVQEIKNINNNKNNLIIDNNNNNEIVSEYFENEDNNNNNIISNNNNNNINNIHNLNNNINNQNNLNNNINNNKLNLNLNNQSYMVFPYNCNLCNEYPIVKVFYYCPVCSIPLCQKCEEKLGINHRHSILKIQTKEQFDDLNSKINGISKEGKNIKKEENSANQSTIQILANNLSTIKDTVIATIFGEGNNSENNNNISRGLNNNNNNNNNQQMMPKKMSLLQLARAQYDLNGVSDNQLQEAIEKSNGNIDEAIVLLMS